MHTNSRACVAVLFSMVGACAGSTDTNDGSGDGGPTSEGGSGFDSSSSVQGDGRSILGSEGGAGPDGSVTGPDGATQDGSSAQEGGSTQDGSSSREAGSATDGGNNSGVHTVGNQLYDGTKAIRLLGVNETGNAGARRPLPPAPG